MYFETFWAVSKSKKLDFCVFRDILIVKMGVHHQDTGTTSRGAATGRSRGRATRVTGQNMNFGFIWLPPEPSRWRTRPGQRSIQPVPLAPKSAVRAGPALRGNQSGRPDKFGHKTDRQPCKTGNRLGMVQNTGGQWTPTLFKASNQEPLQGCSTTGQNPIQTAGGGTAAPGY